MSPGDFRQQAKERRRKFDHAWEAVVKDFQLLEKDTIRPDHCDRVRVSVHKLSDPVQNLSKLLDCVSTLPMSVIPCRYDLLTALHRIDHVVTELPVLLISFQRICRTSSRDTLLQRQEIQRKLIELKQSSDDIQKSVDRMIFMTRAEEGGVLTMVN